MKQFFRFLHSISRAPELSERHYPSAVDPCFYKRVDSISSYLELSRDAAVRARTDLDNEQRDWIIEGNCAFELKPESKPAIRRGIIMVHGLTDSPFLFRDLAPMFRDQGFQVLALQLPGHGTRPGDLLHIRWQDWLDSLRHLLDLLAREVEELYLAGFSIGANLCMYQALRDHRIRGLFLFAPALRINFMAPLACVMARASRVSRRVAWLDILPDRDYFKYESITNRSICEAYRQLGALRQFLALAELRVPVFVVASEADAVVDGSAILQWFAGLTVPRRMLYYGAACPQVPANVRCIPDFLPEQGIQSFSHMSMLQAPDNRHYGKNGAYNCCTHYYRMNPEKYRLCMQRKEQCLGEMFGESKDCQIVRRLTYNPYFADLLEEIAGFIQTMPEAVSSG